MFKRTLVSTLVALTFVMALGACGGDDAPTGVKAKVSAAEFRSQNAAVFSDKEVTYVGKIDDSDAYIAIYERGNKIVGYACDGKQLIKWFGGELNGAQATAKAADGATLTANISNTTAAGSIALADGKTLKFSASLAASPAGLYGRTESSVELEKFSKPAEVARLGWIVLGDSSQRGGKTVSGIPSQTGNVDTSAGTASGGSVVQSPIPTGGATRQSRTVLCNNLKEGFAINTFIYNSPDESQSAKVYAVAMQVMYMDAFEASGCAGSISDPKV